MFETTVDIKTPDGIADTFICHPDGNGPWPTILFYTDATGIRPATQSMARRYAENGYFVVMPNPYYRAGRAPLFLRGDAWLDDAIRPKIVALGETLTPEVTIRDLHPVLDFLAQRKEVKGSKIGCVGYCMGGRMIMRAAAAAPDRIAAAASFHGGRLVIDTPDSPHLLASKIKAELYFGWAEADNTMPPPMIAILETALDAAKVRYHDDTYAGTRHGYAIPDLPSYHAEGDAKHWDHVLSLFGRTLK